MGVAFPSLPPSPWTALKIVGETAPERTTTSIPTDRWCFILGDRIIEVIRETEIIKGFIQPEYQRCIKENRLMTGHQKKIHAATDL
jgi:hypothetical protein